MDLKKEEKEAIETLKEVASDDFDTLGDDISPKMAQNILNVIDKQQKEIEEKTTIIMAGAEKVKRLESQIEELLNVLNNEKKLNYIKPIDIPVHNYISKDKIREKIKELRKEEDEIEKLDYTAEPEKAIDVVLLRIADLNELLEEK